MLIKIPNTPKYGNDNDEADEMEVEGGNIPDIYDFPEAFVDSDEISNAEAGFIRGYNDA